jgi:hypothetical protein
VVEGSRARPFENCYPASSCFARAPSPKALTHWRQSRQPAHRRSGSATVDGGSHAFGCRKGRAKGNAGWRPPLYPTPIPASAAASPCPGCRADPRELADRQPSHGVRRLGAGYHPAPPAAWRFLRRSAAARRQGSAVATRSKRGIQAISRVSVLKPELPNTDPGKRGSRALQPVERVGPRGATRWHPPVTQRFRGFHRFFRNLPILIPIKPRRATAGFVSRKFESSRRRELLSFEHHRTVATLDCRDLGA